MANIPNLRYSEFSSGFTKSNLADITKKKISYGIVQAGPHIPDGLPYIKSKDLNKLLEINALERTSEKIAEKYKRSEVEPGDIIFSLRGNIGLTQILPESIPLANLTQGTARISLNEDFYNKYINSALQTDKVKKRILAVSKGSTFQEISLLDLRKIQISHPGFKEQQKIADFLSSVDNKINLLTEKQSLLQRYKKGVMQKLFSQELRFKDDQGNDFPDCEKVQLKEILELQLNSMNMINESEYELITVKRRNGGVRSRGMFKGKDILVKNQFSLKKNQFVISKRQIVHGACGLVPENLAGAIVSNEYNVFEPVNTRLNIKYFSILASTQPMKKAFFINSDGVHIEKLLFKTTSWLKTKIDLPCLEEQHKIAKFLSEIDKKIDSATQQIKQNQTFKKGLLQQMFV